MMCQHCGKRKSVRPRNLCDTCYRTPAIRAAYPLPPVTNPTVLHRRPPAVRPCRHCGNVRNLRARGLCCKCTPRFRDMYPLDMRWQPKLRVSEPGGTLPEPTEHPPGTLEKIHVLEYRAANNLILFHPADAR